MGVVYHWERRHEAYSYLAFCLELLLGDCIRPNSAKKNDDNFKSKQYRQ